MLDFLPFEERVIRREGVRLFNVTYFDGALAPLLDSNERSCRVKYDPHNMSAVFVELPTGGHLRVPCADLGRPPVTLWEQRAATRTLRKAGRAQRGRAGDLRGDCGTASRARRRAGEQQSSPARDSSATRSAIDSDSDANTRRRRGRNARRCRGRGRRAGAFGCRR